MITKAFEELILKSVLRNDQSGMGDYYIGLCSNASVSRDTPLSEIIEVTGNGYSRIEIGRDSSSWGEPTEQPDCLSLRSVEKVFTANGTWTAFTRLFLCNVASGTNGKLLAVTNPLPASVVLSTGNKYPVSFELFLK